MVVLAGAFGFAAVAFGAFGAHALRERIPAERVDRLELGVRYAFFHVPALLAVAWLAARCGGEPFVAIAGWAFALGVVLFSGSLVAQALSGNRRCGAVTPVGGVLLLVGWVGLAVAGWLLSGPGGSWTALEAC
jgi:uncharacterized membrane protein YgdD (TMEM256/DUF423 family)